MSIKRVFKSVETRSKNSIRSLLAPHAVRALGAASRAVRTLEEAVDLANGFNYYHIRLDPSQISGEILALLKLLEHTPPRTVLEIGTYRGGTFFLFSRVAAPDALLISLDLPPDGSGLGYPPWRASLFRSFAREQQKIELVLANSHEEGTVKQIEKLLGNRPLDFLFIDADHTYEGVKHDYELYAPLVRRGGLIGFHDIVPHEVAPRGVPEFWQELKNGRRITEYVASRQQSGFGIGVVHVGE